MAASSGLAVAATLVSGGVASAASTLQVDTTTDDASLNACTSADNDCSLRGAITDANADPDSTITFASSVTGTIVLPAAADAVGRRDDPGAGSPCADDQRQLRHPGFHRGYGRGRGANWDLR